MCIALLLFLDDRCSIECATLVVRDYFFEKNVYFSNIFGNKLTIITCVQFFFSLLFIHNIYIPTYERDFSKMYVKINLEEEEYIPH